MTHRRAGFVGVFVALLAAAGCHSYTPVSTPAPGTTVRVHIPVVSALQDPNAPPQTETIEGQVVEAGDTLVLALRTRQEYGAFREIIQYDTVRLGPDQRSGVELSEFSTGRSVALGLAIAGGATVLAVTAFGLSGEGGGPIDGGPPPPPSFTGPSVTVSNGLISGIMRLLGGG